MKRTIFVILTLVCLFLFGCNQHSEKISTEAQLKQHLINIGMIKKFNHVINNGDEKIILKEIAFDIGSLRIEYEVPKQLSSLLVKISPDSKLKKDNGRITAFGESNPSFPITAGISSVSISHNLALVNQKIKLDVFIGGHQREFYFDFPGEKIVSLTREVYFNKRGDKITNSKEATTKVVVGLNYIEVESKDMGKDIIVLDLKRKKILQRSLGTYTHGNTIEVFEPLPMPRKNINIKLIPDNNLILISD